MLYEGMVEWIPWSNGMAIRRNSFPTLCGVGLPPDKSKDIEMVK